MSLTCDNQDVEMLKECLFKDPFDLHQEFIWLHINGPANFYQPSADNYFCCECDYIECHHFDNEALSPESRHYLALTCPVCVFRVGKTCNRCYSCGCCLENMIRCGLLFEARVLFENVHQAAKYVLNCYHFHYEWSYIDFCVKGNMYENSLRHVTWYFNMINRREDFSNQLLSVSNLNSRYAKESIHNTNHITHNDDFSMFNTLCRPSSNGSHCANCKM